MPFRHRLEEQSRQILPAELHRRTESLRLREPCVPRGIYARSREAFQALFARRQPGHRGRPDAAKLWSFEATGRGMAGAAAVNGCCEAADLPGVHRGRDGISEAPGAACARVVL